jgi:heme exporter protein D
MMGPGEFGAIVWLALLVLGIVLTIAWIILPFALIGTKPLLRQLIAETRRTNELLQQRREP